MMTKAEVEDLLSYAKFPETVANQRLMCAISYLCCTNAAARLMQVKLLLEGMGASPERCAGIDQAVRFVREFAEVLLRAAPALDD